MFMACATYFQRRFAGDDFLLNNFQSLILASATLTNLTSAWYLSFRQDNANYPARICMSLIMNIVLSTILALSTIFFIMGPGSYIFVVLGCVLLSSWSTGLSQNGVFAYVNTFGGSCMQAVMTCVCFYPPEFSPDGQKADFDVCSGQGIAGVLPAIARMSSSIYLRFETWLS